MELLSDGPENHGGCSFTMTPLFASCQFLLAGFDNESQEREKLGRLLRQGMGTIFWELTEGVTHVIMSDSCGESARESISKFRAEHFHGNLAVVAPQWVLSCCEAKTLLSPLDFPPQKQEQSKLLPCKRKMDATGLKAKTKTTNLFRGCLFVMMRISNPPWAVEYDAKEMEKTVRAHGGQVLSYKLLEVLKKDQTKITPDAPPIKRDCYVVCWGGAGNAQQQFALHPLISQIQRRDLCEVVMVTPIWLRTCVLDQQILKPSYLPRLLEPQTWAVRRLALQPQPPNNKAPKKEPDSTATKTDQALRISVSGFVGPRRTAIIEAIQSIGATYDDSMRKHKTTHLICAPRAVKSSNRGKNQKFLKAAEWGIHVVALDWLYHIMQHGGGGITAGDKENTDSLVDEAKRCEEYNESRFSMLSQSHSQPTET